jgi:hypothetical protein
MGSTVTIGRKAGISDRTVRRVIARLEEGGHILVNRGGGRSSNSYTVVMDIHTPGQGVRAGVTQPRHGSPDTAVSPDPPLIHHGTAAPAPVDDALPAAGPAVGGAVVRFFDAFGPGWLLTAGQRSRLAPAVTADRGVLRPDHAPPLQLMQDGPVQREETGLAECRQVRRLVGEHEARTLAARCRDQCPDLARLDGHLR